MNKFSYAAPKSVGDAVALLAANADAMVMAGGVDLIHEMKQGIRSPALVISLAGIDGLAGIRMNGDRLEIGALAKVRDLISSALAAEHAPILAMAAAEVATPQLRAMGTVVGNILQRPQCWYYRDPDSFCLRKGGQHCHAVSGDNRYHAVLGGGPCHIVCPSDLAPALLALGASVTIAGARSGEREIPLEELFVGPATDPHNEHVLAHDELIVNVTIPSSTGVACTFMKARERTVWDFALSSVSALVARDADGLVHRAAIVLGGVAPNPWNAHEAAESLIGKTLDDDAIDAAAALSVRGARALRDNAYKIELTRSYVARALHSLADA
jgi:xanthine dehydrogenase YagS FAD-binding subunit